MASTTSGPTQAPPKGQAAPGKHVHHGRTAAAWAGTLIALVAFIIGGLAVVFQNWPLFWIGGVGLLIVSLIVTKVLQVTGHGAR
jgi:hypothetical protein